MFMNVILVGCGGALGSILRYLCMILFTHFGWNSVFPYSTLFVNVVGSCVIGLLAGWGMTTLPALSLDVKLFTMVGILGGFTTFSSFSLDFLQLVERGQWGLALTYACLTVLLSFFAVFSSLALVKALS